MKQRFGHTARKLADAAKARPAETRWSLIGAGLGAALGFLVGGVGIAAMGGAAGVPAAVILALLGALIGNRYGISKDRPVM